LEAVEICKKKPDINLVLMDVKMPVMDGYEATKLIKEINPELPVIAVTAYGLSGDKEKALAAGCDDYIAKPFEPDDLIEKLRKYL
jgi:CheY-like chemotaxis protein